MWYDHIQTDESMATNKCPRSSKPEVTPLHAPKKEKPSGKLSGNIKSDKSKVSNECPR